MALTPVIFPSSIFPAPSNVYTHPSLSSCSSLSLFTFISGFLFIIVSVHILLGFLSGLLLGVFPQMASKPNKKPHQRPTSSNLVHNCKGIQEPHRLTQRRKGLASTIGADQAAPVTALVRKVMQGVPSQHPIVGRTRINESQETATIEMVQRRDGIHIILYKHNTITKCTERLATFKFIEGGEFTLEVSIHHSCKHLLSYH